MVRGDLGSAFYELRGRGYDKGCETAGGTGKPDFGEGGRDGGGVVEEGERAVVGYEEDGIEGAVAENGCCGAYAGGIEYQPADPIMKNCYLGEMRMGLPLTRVPARSKCSLKLCGDGMAIAESGVGTVFPACMRVFTRSSGLPIRIPAAPDRYPAQKSADMSYMNFEASKQSRSRRRGLRIVGQPSEAHLSHYWRKQKALTATRAQS